MGIHTDLHATHCTDRYVWWWAIGLAARRLKAIQMNVVRREVWGTFHQVLSYVSDTRETITYPRIIRRELVSE